MTNASTPTGRSLPKPDPLFALLRFNGLAGGGLGLAFVALVLLLDLGHVRSLAFASPDGALAVLLLAVGSVITFASVAMGGALMLMDAPADKPGPPRPITTLRLAPSLRVLHPRKP
jgi:hypothetical protein